MDQAGELRQRARAAIERGVHAAAAARVGVPRVVAVTSGKGGVGKTNVTANLAIALARRGLRVMILDADLGLANIDVVLGLKPQYNVEHLLSGERALAEILVEGPAGVRIMPATSGIERLTHMDETERLRLLAAFEQFEDPLDVLLIDTGAGISPNVMYFAAAAQQTIVVATPEPTSITDAYAVMKVLSTTYGEDRFLLLANNVPNEKSARKIFDDLTKVSGRYLNISIDLLGFIPTDPNIQRAVRGRKAVIDMFPQAAASLAFGQLAERLVATRVPSGPKGGLQFFWQRFLSLG
ncbi:MAG: MinD/ParA family protein [Deltaproteobacteria bacterium]|nr:MinD/ParA family protein [Deltaproteobacteria bacterium]